MGEMVLSVGLEDFTIRYFRTEGSLESDETGTKVFGIKAGKYIDDNLVEESDAGFISEDMEYVDGVINFLGKHTVTPTSLYEVLDDMLA